MEIHEIRYFLALSDTLNFTRAAERCNVSQPSLTRAIQNMEAKLGGGPLVHRERGNTHLTELGSIMKPYCEAMLNEIDAAKSRAKNYLRSESSSLRLGLMCTIGPARLVDFLSDFFKSNPDVDISLVDGPASTIEEQLAHGQLDVAIYAQPRLLEEQFHSIPLFEERFMVALAPSDPLARKNAIRMVDLNQKQYIGRAACEYHDHLQKLRLGIGGIEFKRRYSSDRDDWVQSMVMAGLGFTYVPEYAVSLTGLIARPLIEPEVTRIVQLVTVRGRRHTPTVGAIVREARRYPWAGKIASPINPELGAAVT